MSYNDDYYEDGGQSVLEREDGIGRITNGLFTALIGIVLLGALLPVIISTITGLSSDEVLSGWGGLGAVQTVLYIIPTVFVIGLIITVVRFFSNH